MRNLRFEYKILLVIFIVLLLTALWAENIYVLVLFSLLTYVWLPLHKYWDISAIMLVLFSFTYSAMVIMTDQIGSGSMLISYILAPVAFYRLGKWLMDTFRDEYSRQKLMFVIILCYLIFLFAMIMKDFAEVGIVNVSRTMNVLSGDSDSLAATFYGLMASFGIGCIACVFAQGQRLWLRIGFILLTLFSMLVVVHLVNRTGIVIFFSCFLISLFLSSKNNIKTIVPTLLTITIFIFSLFKLGIMTDELWEAYQYRETESSYSVKEMGGRLGIWTYAISQFVRNPLGWNSTEYAHNLWLDIARIGGWLSLFFFLIVSIKLMRSCVALIFRGKSPFILLIISMNLSLFLSSFVEPVIEGSILFFSLLMMVWGITISLASSTKY